MNLQPQEKKILELKYQSLPFSKMRPEELKFCASALLIKISFITGWSLYEDQDSQGILKEQFQLKIVESYPNVNADEMLYAFRQNTTVKDWGKFMNLALIDEVMIPYLDHRKEVSDLEENLSKPELPPPADNSEFTNEERIETDKYLFRTTKNYRVISQKVAAILFKQKKIERPCEEDCKLIEKQAIHDYHEETRQGETFADKEKEIKKIMNQILVAKYFNSNV